MFECAYCNKHFGKKFNLIRHINVHMEGRIIKSSSLVASQPIDLETIYLTFDSLKDFDEWKGSEEVNTASKYVKHRGSRTNKDKTITTSMYYCHRSGVFVSKANGKRALKLVGSCKIDEHCPSFILTKVKGNNVEIIYCKTHRGHSNEVKFLSIPKKVQETIADKVKSGVPPNIVIDQLRDEFDYTIQKKNLVTRKHIYNISSKFGLLHKYNGGKVTHYINAINNRHHSAVQIHSSKINKTSDITWTVTSETLQQQYLIKKHEPCDCKVICVACKVCVHLFSCTCYDYTIKNNICKHIHAVKINMPDNIDIENKNVFTNPMDTDEICTKMLGMQQINAPSAVSIANKILQFHSMFVSQAGKLSDEELHKINLSLDSSMKIVYQQQSNASLSLNKNENQEPANKNVEKQLRFFSTKKLKFKIPEDQRLTKPTLNVRNQIIDDLHEREESPYVHTDSQFDHAYGK